jgi:serine/threonine protein kinase
MIEAGNRIGRYEVQRRLGRGGMGTVYLAHDPVLSRLVAIKVFQGDLDVSDARERFAREARSAAALNHPNIVVVHDFGEYSAQPYIVMEYIVGETLAQTIGRKAPASTLEKLRWIDELCAAVGYAHEMRVLHRDLKPANLMLDRAGRIKVLDFGVARMMRTLGTNGSGFVGTPGYMAPEQILGANSDPRSDLFSIGVVCYELLAYREAFPGDTIPTVTHRVLHEQPPALADVVPDLDGDLVAAVERAMDKSVEARFPDAATLRQAIAEVRRRLELYGGPDALTVVRGAAPALGASRADGSHGSRGSGAPRSGSQGRVSPGTGTPRPSPRGSSGRGSAPSMVDRIQASLQQARVLLDAGNLDAALTACERALSEDDSNPDAMEVERAIRAAAARRRARALLEEAREMLRGGAVEEAAERVEQARGLNAELAECARLESELRAAREGEHESDYLREPVTPALPEEASPVPPPIDVTIVSPSRSRSTPEPHARATDSRRFTPAAPATPRRTPPSRPSSNAGSSEPSGGGRAPHASPRRVTATSLMQVAAMRPLGVAAAAVLAVAFVGVAFWVYAGSSPQPTGMLVVDALPWGTVTEIRSADGVAHTVPADAATPLVVSLPSGDYEITIQPPTAESKPRRIRVTLEQERVVLAPVAAFERISVDEYFTQYLPDPLDGPLPTALPPDTVLPAVAANESRP